MVENVYWSSSKVELYLSDFNVTWILLTHFRKNPQISNFMKIRPVGAEFFHAEGRTDMTKLIVVFRNFVNAPKNCINQWK